MVPEVMASFPVILALVLLASAVAKLAQPERAAAGFDALGVPRVLSRPVVRRAHPWLEVVLAVALVFSSGWVAVAVAVAATALMSAYLVLVVAALRRPEPVDCACFGAMGPGVVSGWTVARNALLLLVGIVCVLSAGEGRSAAERITGSSGWSVVPLLVAAVVTALVVWPGPASNRLERAAGSAGASVGDPEGRVADEGEYVRTPVPHVPVTLGDGSVVSLRHLARQRPQLVLAVSTTCGACAETVASAPAWSERLPEVDVRLLYAREPAPGESTGLSTLYDPQRYVVEALRFGGTPSAVLLGADGLLAGGPVAGRGEITQFVDDIEAELAVARTPVV